MSSPVSTGAVDLETTTFGPFSALPIAAATARSGREIGRTVFARWRVDRDEDDLRGPDGLRQIGRERKAPRAEIARDHLRQLRLVERRRAGAQQLDLRLVVVDADHAVAEFGKARAGDEADVARADHGDAFHVDSGTGPTSLRAANTSTTPMASKIAQNTPTFG